MNIRIALSAAVLLAATKLVKAGARVVFVSVCNGDSGHQTMDPQALAERRYGETQAAAKVYGIEKYVVMGEHDCLVEPSVDLRKRVTRLIREFAPHMVVTHRTCDYHADHRATGQVVQDATYLMGVHRSEDDPGGGGGAHQVPGATCVG